MLSHTIELRIGGAIDSRFLFTQDTGRVTAQNKPSITYIARQEYIDALRQAAEFIVSVRQNVGPPELGVAILRHELDARDGGYPPTKVTHTVDFGTGLNNYKEVYEAGQIALHPRQATDVSWSDFVLWYNFSKEFSDFVGRLP